MPNLEVLVAQCDVMFRKSQTGGETGRKRAKGGDVGMWMSGRKRQYLGR